MLQILGIRSFVNEEKKEIKYDAFHDKGWRAATIQDLFENIEAFVKAIPAKERYNIYFTPANCTKNKREFQSTSVLWFDIDKVDTARLEEYITVFCKVMAVKREETGIVCSGNGLHFYIGLMVPVVEKDFFKVMKDHYKGALGLLGRAFSQADLPHELDPSVFDARRLMRLPGTKNKKPGKPEKMCELIQGQVVPTTFDLTAISGIPQVRSEDQLDKDFTKRFPDTDNKAILAGCNFIKWCKDKPNEVSEPLWYAALSITARMKDGRAISHDISSGHRSYDEKETDLKIDQAVSASGPRTCRSINDMWGQCQKCPHFQKVNSPIMIQGEDTIKTEKTGFHHVTFDKETGQMKVGKPCFEDLRAFFEKKHDYRVHDKFCWIWQDTYWKEISTDTLESFAQDHFDPYALTYMTQEFKNLILRTNLVDVKEWADTTFKKINFKNGVLDLETMKLLPHSKDYGFKYVLPYEYDAKAKAPRYRKFLADVTGGDKINQETLLEFCGYALSGDACRYEKALVLEGTGSNGKSTFIDVLKAVAGKTAHTSLSFSDLTNPDRRAPLDGTLFNITEETPNKLWDTTAFKNLASGGEVPVRKLYKNAYFMRNRSKLIFSCNELPATVDTTRGFFRRFLIVPFTQRFADDLQNKDVFLKEKLFEELPGIFNLFLEGYQRLVKQGKFSKAEASDKDLAEYEQMTDHVLYWFTQTVQIGPVDDTGGMRGGELYDAYKLFTEEKGGTEAKIISESVFQRRLRTIVPDYEKRRALARDDSKKQFRFLRGIRALIHEDKEI